MKAFYSALTFFICWMNLPLRAQDTAAISLSVLAIGNGYCQHAEILDPRPDANTSANKFLSCFKDYATLCILESSPVRFLSKQTILNVVQSFVDFVEQKGGKQNLGIIYYCGHGLANKAGSMFLVPGDLDANTEDTTFSFMNQKLLNIDEINHIIVTAQLKPNKTSQSAYAILADCCADTIPSQWYKNISYQFSGDTGMVIEYKSGYLQDRYKAKSALQRSAELSFDDLDKRSSSPKDTVLPVLDEIPDMGEMIRGRTMKQFGNRIFYCTQLGQSTDLVPSPYPDSTGVFIGPLCRRSLLYFKNGQIRPTDTRIITDYFAKLLEPGFDTTQPAIVDRSRNIK